MASFGSGNAVTGSYGVVIGPITTSGPTEFDVAQTAKLEKVGGVFTDLDAYCFLIFLVCVL